MDGCPVWPSTPPRCAGTGRPVSPRAGTQGYSSLGQPGAPKRCAGEAAGPQGMGAGWRRGMTAEEQGGALRLEPMDERSAAEVGTRTVAHGGPVLLGRAGGCEISFEDLSVSRRHASLTKREGQWYVVDLGGRHGTYLNGVRLEPERPAAAAQGDFVRIGPYTFRINFGAGARG